MEGGKGGGAVQLYFSKTVSRDQRDGRGVESMECSSRRPELSSQYPCGGSQQPVTPTLGYPMPSPGLCEYCIYLVHVYACKKIAFQKVLFFIYILS